MPSPDTKEEVIAAILSSVDDGKSLRQACREIDFPRQTFEHWLEADKKLMGQYERARANRADKIFEEILSIQDEKPDSVIQLGPEGEGGTQRIDPAFVSWQKNRVDARKWMLGKMAPKKYGDRVELEHSGEVKTGDKMDLSKLSTDDLVTLRTIQAKAVANESPDA